MFPAACHCRKGLHVEFEAAIPDLRRKFYLKAVEFQKVM
jgi:hypothetical protein